VAQFMVGLKAWSWARVMPKASRILSQ